MYLTREEESILTGEEGAGPQRAMELLEAVGKIYDADQLVPITSAHISGVSYKTIGEGGLDFLREMALDAKVKVDTTLNPAGMDLQRWREMGVEESFATRQLQIIDAYSSLGVRTNCTCTPYFDGNNPKMGEHVAWAESSALSFINSMAGARTNREGGPGALAAAIIGKTPHYGLHLKENRAPTMLVKVEGAEGTSELSLVGHAVGQKVGGGIPYFTGIRPGIDGLKAMAAAMAASGSVAMFHVDHITPEHRDFDLSGLEMVEIGKKEMARARESLTTGTEPDLIALGCPHLSEFELKALASYLDGKRRRDGPEVWFCTSRTALQRCPKERLVLERFGMVLTDTCMIVAPIERNHQCTGCNSAKACSYLPSLCSQRVVCADQRQLLEMVL